MAKKVKITKGGQTVYPATVMDAVVHPDLRVDASKLIEEVNVSKIYPTGGIDGTNKYTLETAIAQVPSAYRKAGLKVSFIDESNNTQSWEYKGGSWAASNFAEVGARKFSELNSKTLSIPIASLIELQSGDFINGIYIDANGQQQTNINYSATDFIDVRNYQYIGFNAFVGDATYLAYYDINKSKIGTVQKRNADDLIIKKPSNAYYVRCSNKTTNQQNPSICAFNNSMLDQVGKSIGGVFYDYETESGAWLSNGNVYSDARAVRTEFDCLGIKSITFLDRIPTAQESIVFLDKEGVVIKFSYLTKQDAATLRKEEVPNEAAKCKLCWHKDVSQEISFEIKTLAHVSDALLKAEVLSTSVLEGYTNVLPRDTNPSTRYFNFSDGILTTKENLNVLNKTIDIDKEKDYYIGAKVSNIQSIEDCKIVTYIQCKNADNTTVLDKRGSYPIINKQELTVYDLLRKEDIPEETARILLQIDLKIGIGAKVERWWLGYYEPSENNRAYFSQNILNYNDAKSVIANSAIASVAGFANNANITKSIKYLKESYADEILTTLGDSVTFQHKWTDWLIKYLGLSTFNNCGISGSMVSQATETSMNNDKRIETIPLNTTLFTFMGGINDWNGSIDLGEAKMSNVDITTFYGALNVMSKKTIQRIPKARIIYLTPNYAETESNISSKGWENAWTNSNGNTIYDFAKAIKDVASWWGFPCVDICGEWGINHYNCTPYFSTNEPTKRHHPTSEGGKIMADLIYAKLVLLSSL